MIYPARLNRNVSATRPGPKAMANPSAVDIRNASAIFQVARHPKSFVSLDPADHLLTKTVDTEYATIMIAGRHGGRCSGQSGSCGVPRRG
jgi:hypothetical protein